MYIFEVILKKFFGKKKYMEKDSLEEEKIEDSETCGHIFFTIDTTGEHLACKNCGLVIKNPGQKGKKNPFKED